MKIIGFDVSGGYATAIFLAARPSNLIEYAQSEDFAPFRVEAKEEDLLAIADLAPDLIVLEPSGGHYERVFCNWFDRQGLKWKRVVGHRIESYRRDQGLAKTDPLDALALAAYGYDKENDPKAWIEECALPELREMVLQRYGLIKIQKRYIQRLRLQLEHEFPEVASSEIHRDWGQGVNGLLSWIVGENVSKQTTTYYEKLYRGGIKNPNGRTRREIPPTIGSGISPHTKCLARHLKEIWSEVLEIEERCDRIMEAPEVKPYLDACLDMGLNREVASVWLTRIYPFSRFLNEDGTERRTKRRSRSGKLCTQNLSLSQFKAALGAGTVRNESGTRQVGGGKARRGWRDRSQKERPEYVSGDSHSRRVFFMWFLGKINIRKNSPKTGDLELIRLKNIELSNKNRNVYQRGCNVQGYAAKLLYRKLKRTLG